MSVQGSGPDSDLVDRIRTIIAEQFGVNMAEVSPDSSIIDDLGADSLDVVELVMTLEDEFDIEVSDEAAESIRTIADVRTTGACRGATPHGWPPRWWRRPRRAHREAGAGWSGA